MKATTLIFSLSSLVVVTGCGVEREVSVDENVNLQFDQNSDFSSFGGFHNLVGRNARVVGDVGLINVDSNAKVLGQTEPGYAVLEVLATTVNGSVMNLITLENGLDDPRLVDGQKVSLALTDAADEETDSVVVCSTEQEPGNWDYDDVAESGTIEVADTEDPETKLVTIEVVDSDGFGQNRVSHSMFTYRPGDL